MPMSMGGNNHPGAECAKRGSGCCNFTSVARKVLIKKGKHKQTFVGGGNEFMWIPRGMKFSSKEILSIKTFGAKVPAKFPGLPFEITAVCGLQKITETERSKE